MYYHSPKGIQGAIDFTVCGSFNSDWHGELPRTIMGIFAWHGEDVVWYGLGSRTIIGYILMQQV